MAGNRRRWVVRAAASVLGGCLVTTLSCGLPEALVNNTVSLGWANPDQRGQPGERGHVQVALINNTQYFVSLTLGTYDPLDHGQTLVGLDLTNTSLDSNYVQVFADSTHTVPRLEPGATSPTITFLNGRTVSLGDREFIQAIKDRDTNAKNLTLTEGITFSDKLLDADGVQQFTINGVANQTQLLGTDYQPESLLVFTFQPDATQANGVRIDVKVTLP